MVKKITGIVTTGHILNTGNAIATTGHITSGSNGINGINGGTQYIIDSVVSELKECIEVNITKNTKICELVEEIRSFQLENAQGYVPIEENDLLDIYENFILPYINCEVYLMGGITSVIRLNKIIDDQIAIAVTERAKLMLKILKDIMTVLINARNDKVGLIQYQNRITKLEGKYNDCQVEVINLRHKIELMLDQTPRTYGLFKGTLGIKLKKIKPFIYMQARFDIDRAWYMFLYPGCAIDPQKYAATITYVRSFGTLQNAYSALLKLLDEQFASVEDDLEKKSKLLKENEENKIVEQEPNEEPNEEEPSD